MWDLKFTGGFVRGAKNFTEQNSEPVRFVMNVTKTSGFKCLGRLRRRLRVSQARISKLQQLNPQKEAQNEQPTILHKE